MCVSDSSYHADLEALPASGGAGCNLLPEQACDTVSRDPFTALLAFWASLQLIWVTMLLFVQYVQIAKARTTYESVRGYSGRISRTQENVATAVFAGTTSMDSAQLTAHSLVSNTTMLRRRHAYSRHDSCFTQWKQLLGLGSFVAAAQEGLNHHDRFSLEPNPFSRGLVTNCKDFWCDSEPYFGRRKPGTAMLDGKVIDYTTMYDIPPRTRQRPMRTVTTSHYEALDSAESV